MTYTFRLQQNGLSEFSKSTYQCDNGRAFGSYKQTNPYLTNLVKVEDDVTKEGHEDKNLDGEKEVVLENIPKFWSALVNLCISVFVMYENMI